MDNKKQIYEHPSYSAQKEDYQIWLDLCNGGKDIEGKSSYLPQHEFESQKQYGVRLQLSTYKNHAKPVVSVFSSSIWRKPAERKIPDVIGQYSSDVDRMGTDAEPFFKDLSNKAASQGAQFIVVDSTKAPKDVEIKTAADSARYNIRPYFTIINPLMVVDWAFDYNGLVYTVIQESEITKAEPFSKAESKTRFRIWYRDRYELWEESDKDGLILIEENKHPVGEVPIVPCYFRKKEEMVGDSCIKEIASLLRRAYVMENTLDKSLFDTAFPQQAFYGFDPEQIKEYIRASSNGLVSPEPSAKSEFVEPAGRAFAALESKVRNDEVSIREIALRMVRPDSKVGESAESKRIDNQQLDSQLSIFAGNMEDCEKKCWMLMLKWVSGTGDIEVKYNRDFDLTQITGDMVKSFSEMKRDGNISRETFWEILKKAEVPFPEDWDPAEEKARIEADNRTSGTFGAIGNRLLGGIGQ